MGISKTWRQAALVAGVVMGAAPPAIAEVTLSEAWVRALPPTQRNTAAYVTVHNSGAEPLQVVGGSAELADRVEIHRSEGRDGMTRMVPVAALPVPAGGSVSLAPGGTHLMLLELERMPAEGETLELCLALADERQICTEAPVQRSEGKQDHSHHH